LAGSYAYRLVALSVQIAVFASTMAFEVAGRVTGVARPSFCTSANERESLIKILRQLFLPGVLLLKTSPALDAL